MGKSKVIKQRKCRKRRKNSDKIGETKKLVELSKNEKKE